MKIDYPYLRKQKEGKGIRIEVAADSMRVGKTTAAQVIAEGLRKRGFEVYESYEDWRHNPYLEKSYEDPAKNFLESQKWFIKRKWEQVRDGAKKGVFLQDVSPEMDYCYAATNMKLGRMSREHFEEYQEFYHDLDWKKVPAPNLLVYLAVSDDELIRRAMDSRREFETVEPEYFLMMKRVNQAWLKGATDKMNVLVVDTDKLDFANVQTAKNELVTLVLGRIGLDWWFRMYFMVHDSSIPLEFQISAILPDGRGTIILDRRLAYNYDPYPEDNETFYVACDDVGSEARKGGFFPPDRSGHFERPGVWFQKKESWVIW